MGLDEEFIRALPCVQAGTGAFLSRFLLLILGDHNIYQFNVVGISISTSDDFMSRFGFKLEKHSKTRRNLSKPLQPF